MNIALYVIAAICLLGSVATIARIGKPRAPLTAGEVAIITVLNAAVIVILVLAAIKLT